MKRGLSTGDIASAAAGDGASTGVIKPVRSRRKKPKNLDTSLTHVDVDMLSSNTYVQQTTHQNINATTNADNNPTSAALISQLQTRSSADADNRLDAFSGQSRSTNMVPFHMLHIVSYCPIVQ